MASKHGFVFAEEPVHATPPADVGKRWSALKVEFVAVAFSDNYLSSHQLFQIWQNFWMEQRTLAGEDEDKVRRRIHGVNPVAYADNMNRFELGARDALGPDYREVADRLDATNAMLFAASQLLGWLEAREAMGEHCTLQQANERAIEITKAWNRFETWFAPVIFAVLGVGAAKPMSGSRGGRYAPAQPARPPAPPSHLPPEPAPSPSIPPHLRRVIQGDYPAVRLGRFGQPGNLFARVDSTGGGVTYRVTAIVLRGEGAAEVALARSAHRAMIRRAAEMAQKIGAKTFKLVGEQANPNFRKHADGLADTIGVPKSGKSASKSGGGYSDYEVTLRVDLTLRSSAPSPAPPPARPAPPSGPAAPPAKK
ncbi:MAG TPA: hypothetical protein PKY50_11870 [Candidatus Competibacter sp.]|nr:hypothetical protein [Candidatus Competibacter sp.]